MARPLRSLPLLVLLSGMLGASPRLAWGAAAPPTASAAVQPPMVSAALAELRSGDGWEFVLQRAGVAVWKRTGANDDAAFAVKAVVDVPVPARWLAALLLTRDYSTIRRFNPTVVDGRDLEWCAGGVRTLRRPTPRRKAFGLSVTRRPAVTCVDKDRHTCIQAASFITVSPARRDGRKERVTYIRTKPVWPLRPRDFVCRVRHEQLASGDSDGGAAGGADRDGADTAVGAAAELIVNSPTTHAAAPPCRGHVRATLRGVHLIEPTAAAACRYTCIHEALFVSDN